MRLILVIISAILAPSGGAWLTCYQCSGYSGNSNITAAVTSCGLPFKDNVTVPLPTVLCDGICVTQVVFYTGKRTRGKKSND